jgi:hypothetical protein
LYPPYPVAAENPQKQKIKNLKFFFSKMPQNPLISEYLIKNVEFWLNLSERNLPQIDDFEFINSNIVNNEQLRKVHLEECLECNDEEFCLVYYSL